MWRRKVLLGTSAGSLQSFRMSAAWRSHKGTQIFDQASRDRRSGRYIPTCSCSTRTVSSSHLQLPTLLDPSRSACWEARLSSRCITTLASLGTSSAGGWAVSAAAGAYLILAHQRWRQRQQLFVESGACAAAADLPTGPPKEGLDDPSNSLMSSRINDASGRAIEYVWLANPRSSATCDVAAEGGGGGDVLMFFHGGLCGSDQLMASGIQFPPGIKHIFLPNRQGYLRSDSPPPWDETVQPQVVRPRRRPYAVAVKEGPMPACDPFRLYKHRMQQQAALFDDLVTSLLQQRKPRTFPTRAADGGLHLLGVGEGCAHAVAYAHFFPQRVRSIALLAPLLQLQQHTAAGPLERHILGRIQVYRQIIQRLPPSMPRLPLPPPKISFLEWLASSASRVAPATGLTMLLHALYHHRGIATAPPSVQQFLAELQEQQTLQGLLQYPDERQTTNPPDEGDTSPGATSWHMQQQEAWTTQQRLYRQVLQRVKHVTGTCCVTQRLPGFLEDALLLMPWGGPEKQSRMECWLLQCLAELQVPRLLVLAGESNGKEEIKQYLAEPRGAPLVFVEMPKAHPQIMLLTHAAQLNSALGSLYNQFASAMPV